MPKSELKQSLLVTHLEDYVLKGWMSFHYHGHGEHKLQAGDCHIIPPGLSHTVTGW